MVRHPPSGSSQTWATLLRNHMAGTIACDFFTVPTVAFRKLYVFIVLHHGSRRILKVGVTEHPAAEWTAQNIVEAVGDHEALRLTHLIRDRDKIYGDVFTRKAKALGLEEIVTPKASPWRNGFAERHPTRVHRSHHPVRQATPAARGEGVRCLLQPRAVPPIARRRRACQPTAMVEG